jgi:hypothetical protein
VIENPDTSQVSQYLQTLRCGSILRVLNVPLLQLPVTLLLTVFSPEELMMRIVKVLF